jgi:hypothetical protein
MNKSIIYILVSAIIALPFRILAIDPMYQEYINDISKCFHYGNLTIEYKKISNDVSMDAFFESNNITQIDTTLIFLNRFFPVKKIDKVEFSKLEKKYTIRIFKIKDPTNVCGYLLRWIPIGKKCKKERNTKIICTDHYD